MATAGSIIVDLLMRTGSFETDTARATKAAEKSFKSMQRSATIAGEVIGDAITGSVKFIAQLGKELLIGAADFQDLSEMIGDSAENIASLSVAAATAGVSMESVGAASIKLTKGLTGVDDESKAAGAAVAALGLNIEDFKALKPVEQFEAVGKALAGFEDGAQKTAVAVALFGKAGAEQLKVFKALEEQGGRTVILTQAQIAAADAYADASAKQTAILKAYAQAAATDVLPALNDLKGAATELAREFFGIDEAGKKLAGESPVKAFADATVDSLAFVIDAGDGVVRTFQIIGKALATAAAEATAIASGNFKEASAIEKAFQADLDGILNRKWFSDRVEGMRALRKETDALAGFAKTAASFGSSKPTLKFEGAEKADKVPKEKTTEAERYLERLKDQIQKTRELTEVEKVLDDIVTGRFKGAKAGQANQALALAEEIDRTKQFEKATKDLVAEMDKQEEASNRLREAGKAIFDKTRTPAEQYAAELANINSLLAAGAINSDTYQRRVLQLQDEFDASAKKIRDEAREINQAIEGSGANAFADFISGTRSAKDAFSDFAKSVISDLIRIESQKLARQLLGGGDSGAGGFGGLLAGILSGLGKGGTVYGGSGTTDANLIGDYALPGKAAGGPVSANSAYMVGERGPERFVPHVAGTIIPNHALSNAGGGSIQVVNPPGIPLQAQASDQKSPDGRQLNRIILNTVREDARSGGPGIRTQAAALGTSRALPRRGR
jgi:hypothetical protein